MFWTVIIAGGVGAVSFVLGAGVGASYVFDRITTRKSFTWQDVGYRVESLAEAEPVAVVEREIHDIVTKYMRRGAYDADIARINLRNAQRNGNNGRDA